MLTQIHIRDLATIQELHLNLENGCTMITGETGAGKSIFIEAIELALGGRASQNIIRQGKDKAEISLCFDISHFPMVIEKLKLLDLYEGVDECIIRRVIVSDGPSRCYVNGAPSTLHCVKELGELLFHLHGQHEQQVLLQMDTQRDMLDRYADHLPLVAQVKQLAEEWKQHDQQIKMLTEKAHERSAREDYLRFQFDELQLLNLQAGEWEKLENEHKRLTHSEELLRNVQHTLQQLGDENDQSVLAVLHNIYKIFESLRPLEAKSNEWINTIESSLVQLNDLENELQNYRESIERDPERVRELEERIGQIFTLSRKHKIAPQDLITYQQQLSAELKTLNSSEEELQRLTSIRQAAADNYQKLAMKLSQSRTKAALKLSKEITATIRSLSLPHSEMMIELEKETLPLSSHGNEKIVFLIKTNPDQPVQPIAKIISGGELSRLSLAAHLALASRTNIPTLVFDEIDTGLSGATAEKIGKLLRKLGESYQVFCVTHQAQVAACGHHHLLVEKYFIAKSTHTRLRVLEKNDKTREIARMLGGENITEKTLAHAKEVLQGG